MSSSHAVTARVKDTVKHWNLWRPREPLFVAVSGGIDSMVLADCLHRLPEGERPRVSALHFNHRLREESEGEARFVRSWCRERKIPCLVGRAPKWRVKNNVQERARRLRYEFFRRKVPRGRIATAHHADDQAETFLIRWIQGAGLKGLAGIPVVREDAGRLFVRPLLFVTREEIQDYAKKFDVPFRTDPTNFDDRYLRGSVRKILKGARSKNGGLARRSAVNSVFLRADHEYLKNETDELCRKILNGKGEFPLRRYKELPPALRYRVLQRMVEEAKGGNALIGGDFILKMDRLLTDRNPRLQYDLSGGLRFVKDYARFKIGSRQES